MDANNFSIFSNEPGMPGKRVATLKDGKLSLGDGLTAEDALMLVMRRLWEQHQTIERGRRAMELSLDLDRASTVRQRV